MAQCGSWRWVAREGQRQAGRRSSKDPPFPRVPSPQITLWYLSRWLRAPVGPALAIGAHITERAVEHWRCGSTPGSANAILRR